MFQSNVWGNPELDDALAECRRTCRGPLPCVLPEYLAARRAYHALLVKHGMLDPRLMDPQTGADLTYSPRPTGRP